MIERQPLKQLDNVALKGRAQWRLHFLREGRFLVDLLQVRDEFLEGEILFLVRFPAERGQGVGVADDKNLSLIGLRRLHHHLGQPIHRGHRALVGPEGLLPVNDEERIARDGVERLDPAVQQDRQPAELLDCKTAAFVVLEKRRDHVKQRRRHDQPENPSPSRFHRALFLTKPKRCIENCTSRPAATRPQAM